MPTRIAPKKAKAFYNEALDKDVHLSFDVPEDVADPFDAAEFYPNGLIATVSKDDILLRIHREGEAALVKDDYTHTILEPSEFREEFPDGNTQRDGYDWRRNPWFEVYQGESGPEGAVFDSLDEAVRYAIQVADVRSRGLKAARAAIDAYTITLWEGEEPDTNTEIAIVDLVADLRYLLDHYRTLGYGDVEDTWEQVLNRVNNIHSENL